MSITIAEYDRSWPQQFRNLASKIAECLCSIDHDIEHVGSTSVPGLCAKPILDIDVVVARAAQPDAIVALATLGYQSQGDLGIADRIAMKRPTSEVAHNLYVVARGSLALRNHLVVREALLHDDVLRNRYGALKKELAAVVGDDRESYCHGKTKFLLEVLRNGGVCDEELAQVRRENSPKVQ